MPMQLDVQPTHTNIVVVAQSLNPSIFNHLWLARHGGVAEDDFLDGCVFTRQVVKVETKQFSMLAVPDRMQFAPRGTDEETKAGVAATVLAIVTKLDQTPYTAFGYNMLWHVKPREGDFGEFDRRLFCREGDPLCAAFGEPDARFGAYMSKDVLGFRLKLDIKPVGIPRDGTEAERLRLAFNFHLGLSPDERVAEIEAALAKWREAEALASQMVSQMLGGT